MQGAVGFLKYLFNCKFTTESSSEKDRLRIDRIMVMSLWPLFWPTLCNVFEDCVHFDVSSFDIYESERLICRTVFCYTTHCCKPSSVCIYVAVHCCWDMWNSRWTKHNIMQGMLSPTQVS